MVLLLREEVHSAGSAGMTMHPILFIHKVCSPTGYTKQNGIPQRYKAELENILKNVWNEEEIKKEINRIQALTKNHLHPRQDRKEQSVERLISFVEGRRSKFESELNEWPVKVSVDQE